MREIFHGQLAQLGAELSTMCGLVRAAMEQATRALLDTELVLAERVITGDAEIDHLGVRCEEHACVLLALQAPVAGDLRTVVMAIRACERIARMGDLAQIDRLHRQVLDKISHADPPYPIQIGVDVALLARYFERFADQAVAVTRQLDFVVTGEMPPRSYPGTQQSPSS